MIFKTVVIGIVIAKSMGVSAADVFSTTTLENMVKQSLQTEINTATDFNVILDNPQITIAKPTEQASLKIIHIKVTPDQKRFDAEIGVDNQKPLRIRGKIQLIGDIPVLNRAIGPGEEITEADITWQKMPLNRLNASVISRVENLVGKTPRSRLLQPNQPLLQPDVQFPVLIKKGAMVRVVYNDVNLSIARTAEAKQQGSKGETIRLLIPESKKEIQAIVVGPNQAEISPVRL